MPDPKFAAVRSILINAHARADTRDAGSVGHGALMVIIEIVAPNQPGGGREPRCNLHKRIVNFFHTFFIGLRSTGRMSS